MRAFFAKETTPTKADNTVLFLLIIADFTATRSAI